MSDGSPTTKESTGQSVKGYNVPGRSPDSHAPWEFFLGNAAHRLITYMYKVNHPEHTAYFNTRTLLSILQDARLGEPSRLLPQESGLCSTARWLRIAGHFDETPAEIACVEQAMHDLLTEDELDLWLSQDPETVTVEQVQALPRAIDVADRCRHLMDAD